MDNIMGSANICDLPLEIIKIIAHYANFYKFSHLNKELRIKTMNIYYDNNLFNIKKIDSID